MKSVERTKAIELRKRGESIKNIAIALGVAKSSVSTWVRTVELNDAQKLKLSLSSHSTEAVERRRSSRLKNEEFKRNVVIHAAKDEIGIITKRELWLTGVALYWAEGGKTQRMIRFSNGDPRMIEIMMKFFREVCDVPEGKFRGYIHIHSHLDHDGAKKYWSNLTRIPEDQFFKTYRKASVAGVKDSLPYGVLDVYVLDTTLFYKMQGWIKGMSASISGN